MIGVHAHALVKPEHARDFEKLSQELAEKSRDEPGLISYDFGPRTNGKNNLEFAFIERWDSIESLEAHMETEHYLLADRKCQKLLAAPMQINIYDI